MLNTNSIKTYKLCYFNPINTVSQSRDTLSEPEKGGELTAVR